MTALGVLRCPVCGTSPRKSGHVACPTCWGRVPKPLQQRVYAAYRRVRREPTDANVQAHLDVVHEAIEAAQ